VKKTILELAPGVACYTRFMINVYLVGEAGRPWVLVDTGHPGEASQILDVAYQRFGQRRPDAIILTHGHMDHVGSARALADHWNTPIYAHPLEMPYLTGRSPYPAPDPTVGGASSFIPRLVPSTGVNLGPRVRELQSGLLKSILPGWEHIFTPGHSPGHIALYRAEDGVLLAGDAVTTVDVETWRGMLSGAQQLEMSPAFANYDWDAVQNSIRKLAALRPRVIGAGHGTPMSGDDVADKLEALTKDMRVPPNGRYSVVPARTDAAGIVALPPAVPDPVGKVLLGLGIGAGIAGAAGIGLAVAKRWRK